MHKTTNQKKKKRPRLLWNFVKFYAHHEEDQAKVFIINEFTSPGFPLAKDQPYYCQNKLVQTFKCSAKRRYGYHFKAKVVCKGVGDEQLFEVYICGAHNHTQSDQTQKHGIPHHHKGMLERVLSLPSFTAKLH